VRTTVVLRPSALCFLQHQRDHLVSVRSEDATSATPIAVLRTSTADRLQCASAPPAAGGASRPKPRQNPMALVGFQGRRFT